MIMIMDNENNDVSVDKICPKCGVGNPDNVDNCIVCDKDLEETVLFLKMNFMI
jgi:ribosomal protein L40E